MKTLPMFFQMVGRRFVIAGGGKQAKHKTLLGDLATLAARMRSATAARLAPHARGDVLPAAFNGTPPRLFARGTERVTAKLFDTRKRGASHEGKVSLVGAGPGAKDLITLRGVQHMQEADVIYYDRLLDPEILELAQPDATRVYVGKAPGCHSWSQAKITRTLVSAAKCGQRVVRLKCGDPGIFGRSTEETDALKAAGIPFEIVPGVTAACAAAASAGQSLTDRGGIDTLVLTTGHRTNGYTVPEPIADIRPGTCVALYMAVGAAQQIVDTLRAQHPEVRFDVQVAAKAQRKGQVLLDCTLEELPKTLTKNDITGEAMLFVRWARNHETAERRSAMPGTVSQRFFQVSTTTTNLV